VKRITFFVGDLDAATAYYRDAIGLTAADIHESWSSFVVSRETEISFKGRGGS
jgi:catechol 2,3-dioxygenase-like lactoylglutathione lyase family enzyme